MVQTSSTLCVTGEREVDSRWAYYDDSRLAVSGSSACSAKMRDQYVPRLYLVILRQPVPVLETGHGSCRCNLGVYLPLPFPTQGSRGVRGGGY